MNMSYVDQGTDLEILQLLIEPIKPGTRPTE